MTEVKWDASTDPQPMLEFLDRLEATTIHIDSARPCA